VYAKPISVGRFSFTLARIAVFEVLAARGWKRLRELSRPIAFRPEHFKLLSPEIQDAASEFYRDLRSLKTLRLAPPARGTSVRLSPFERRKELDKKVTEKGTALLLLLQNAV